MSDDDRTWVAKVEILRYINPALHVLFYNYDFKLYEPKVIDQIEFAVVAFKLSRGWRTFLFDTINWPEETAAIQRFMHYIRINAETDEEETLSDLELTQDWIL